MIARTPHNSPLEAMPHAFTPGNLCPDVEEDITVYAPINIQPDKYTQRIDFYLQAGETDIVLKRFDTSNGSATTKTLGETAMLNMFSKMSFFGLLTVSAALAQSGQPIQTKVPFAFTVSNTTLPAGNYQLTYGSSAQRLTIRGLDANSSSASVAAFPTSSPNSSNQPGKLVFNCHGNNCYLAQVWQGPIGGDRGLQLLGGEWRRTVAVSARIVAVSIPATNRR